MRQLYTHPKNNSADFSPNLTSQRVRHRIISKDRTPMAVTDTEISTAAARSDEGSYGLLYDTYGNTFEVPNYTLKQLTEVIPARCFERSLLTGTRYVIQDLSLIGCTFYVANTYITPSLIPSFSARFILWSLYTVLQGIFGTGIWVLAHECNHQAFSEYNTVNDITGWILHSAILVPYFSWKITHKQHHSVHNNLAKDLHFVPKDREAFAKHNGYPEDSDWELVEDAPLYNALQLFCQQLWGWPYYLLANDSGSDGYQKRSDGRGKGKRNGWGGGVNHFDPNSPLFAERDAHLIYLSQLGIVITLGIVWYLGHQFGHLNMLVWYWIPYLWVNHWLGECDLLLLSDPKFHTC
jgi:omega-6 fatty acid desaturase (delta-12 desaturase)